MATEGGWNAGLAELMFRPAVVETLLDLLLCAVPIWLAVMIGLLIGWSWRPRWTGLVFLGLRGRLRLQWIWTLPLGFGARRLWLAFTALSAFSICRRLWSNFNGKGIRSVPASSNCDVSDSEIVRSADICEFSNGSNGVEARDTVTEKDLDHFLTLLDDKAEDRVWHHMMERTTQNMTYQAWRHEPEVGPVIYRSRTVFEDATPEIVRDFFWDDDFRLKWDHMLSYFKLLEESPDLGTSIVHWIKKFPFFCSDREYIFCRRIWESVNTYLCITKGIQHPSLPKKDKPRRVDLYFSSWRIRAVDSRRQDGQLSACEVTLVHYEDMGIPKDVAKVGVRHGMWGAVKRLQSGMRAYQLERNNGSPLSRSAYLAQYTTKITASLEKQFLSFSNGEASAALVGEGRDDEERGHGIDWKWIAVGGAIAVVCGIQTGVVGKGLLLGVGKRLAKG